MRDVYGATGRTYSAIPVDVERISDGRDSWTVNLVLSDAVRRSMVRGIARAVHGAELMPELGWIGSMSFGEPSEFYLLERVLDAIPDYVFEVQLGPSQAEDLAENLSSATACAPLVCAALDCEYYSLPDVPWCAVHARHFS